MKNILVLLLASFLLISMIKSRTYHGPTYGIICGQNCVEQTFRNVTGHDEFKCCEIKTKINETLTWTQICCTKICTDEELRNKHCHDNNCHSCELQEEEDLDQH